MKLYAVSLKLLDRPWGSTPDEEERWTRLWGKPHTIVRVELTLEGSGRYADEGDWSVPDSALPYLGQSSGYWYLKKSDDHFSSSIWLMEDEDPNFVSWLWRDMPAAVGVLHDVLKVPLFLGETGTGRTLPARPKQGHPLAWGVSNRGV